MKAINFKAVKFFNKKKEIHITYTSGKKAIIHYSSLGISSIIKNIQIDKETAGKSLKVTFSSGKIDYIPYDQPLFLIKDPEYMLYNHIENVISQIKDEIKRKRISKKHIARQLKTSDNQLQQLLNPKILNKNLPQLYKLTGLLGLEFKVSVKVA